MRSLAYKLAAVFLGGAALFYFYTSHYEVPVLMYHQVVESDGQSSLQVSPETFKRQMEFLKAHGYHVVPLESLIRDLKNKKSIPLNTVAITFDDGFLDNFQNAFPVLKEMNFPATIFVITENINKEHWLFEEDLRILDDSGISIGSHTVTHAFLPDHSAEEVETELRHSKEHLEEILGHSVTLFSYPAGGVTPPIRQAVEKAGYVGAVTTNYGKTRHDPYALHRVKVSDAHGNLFNFWFKVSGLSQLGKKRVEAKGW